MLLGSVAVDNDAATGDSTSSSCEIIVELVRCDVDGHTVNRSYMRALTVTSRRCVDAPRLVLHVNAHACLSNVKTFSKCQKNKLYRVNFTFVFL